MAPSQQSDCDSLGSQAEPGSPCTLLFLWERLHKLLLDVCSHQAALDWSWEKLMSTIKGEDLGCTGYQSGRFWEASLSR